MGDDRQHLSETEASGGVKVGAMRYVLGVSLALIIVLFLVVIFIWR